MKKGFSCGSDGTNHESDLLLLRENSLREEEVQSPRGVRGAFVTPVFGTCVSGSQESPGAVAEPVGRTLGVGLPVYKLWGALLSYWLGQHRQVVYRLCFQFLSCNLGVPELNSGSAGCSENEMSTSKMLRKAPRLEEVLKRVNHHHYHSRLASQASTRAGNN